jgi:Na_pump_decarbB: sodium ion-translocating decarboxylase, beta subunit
LQWLRLLLYLCPQQYLWLVCWCSVTWLRKSVRIQAACLMLLLIVSWMQLPSS